MANNNAERKKLTPRQYQKNQQACQARWRKQHTKSITFMFNLDGDADVLQKLASVPNKTDYLRKIIRKDIVENGID